MLCYSSSQHSPRFYSWYDNVKKYTIYCQYSIYIYNPCNICSVLIDSLFYNNTTKTPMISLGLTKTVILCKYTSLKPTQPLFGILQTHLSGPETDSSRRRFLDFFITQSFVGMIMKWWWSYFNDIDHIEFNLIAASDCLNTVHYTLMTTILSLSILISDSFLLGNNDKHTQFWLCSSWYNNTLGSFFLKHFVWRKREKKIFVE